MSRLVNGGRVFTASNPSMVQESMEVHRMRDANAFAGLSRSVGVELIECCFLVKLIPHVAQHAF